MAHWLVCTGSGEVRPGPISANNEPLLEPTIDEVVAWLSADRFMVLVSKYEGIPLREPPAAADAQDVEMIDVN